MMRFIGRVFVALLMLVALVLGAAWLTLRASLPMLEGRQPLPGLSAVVIVERDALGTVTVAAKNSLDMARSLGFLHAQERYFQMDLLRRMAAGELSELVGNTALPLDRSHRAHRFRVRAREAIASLPASDRRRLEVYRDGVNAGLNALSARPWEYFVLRSQPIAWKSEDTALVIYAMFFDLNSGGANARELNLARMRAVLPHELINFLVQPGSQWDAPLRGEAYATLPIPDVAQFDLHLPEWQSAIGKIATANVAEFDPGLRPGSNNFAVAGALTASGSALVANDMHLGLGVPNIWFRARLRYEDAHAEGGKIELNGLTLPGVPGLVAGSNGHIAWGFTNSYGDWLDWVRVQRDESDSSGYRTATGVARIKVHEEIIHVKGGESEILRVEETQWGPILATDVDGTALALKWTAHDPRCLNLAMFELEQATDTETALEIASRVGMPAQNFVVGDRHGSIGWTLTGNGIPLRTGFDPLVPADFARGNSGWQGWLDSGAYPQILNPPEHRLWSANARTVEGDWLTLSGDGGFDLGARQQQIRNGLFAIEHFTEKEMLAIQLDDRAIFLKRWYELLRRVLAKLPADKLTNLRAVTEKWQGRASIDSIDFRMVRAFRLYVIESVLAPFGAIVKQKFQEFTFPSAQAYEAPVWSLIEQQPEHFLDPKFSDWNALLTTAAEKLDTELGQQPGGLFARTWGERNTSNIRHPLSSALPSLLAKALDMPRKPLPGDSNMPRVQSPEFGASQRFAIAPGHEDKSYLMMPGGQSAHPLSPFHQAGHSDWEDGIPTPLLPGKSEFELMFIPESR